MSLKCSMSLGWKVMLGWNNAGRENWAIISDPPKKIGFTCCSDQKIAWVKVVGNWFYTILISIVDFNISQIKELRQKEKN